MRRHLGRKRFCAIPKLGEITATLLVLVSGPALAQDPAPKQREQDGASKSVPDEQPYVHRGAVYMNATVARYNPLGLSNFVRIGYQWPLLGPQKSILLQRTQISLHAMTSVTPAFVRGGVRLDVQPLAFLVFYFSYEGMQLFGNFDSLQSFRNVSADFSNAAQAAGTVQGKSQATYGGIFTAEALLQAKVGPIVVFVDDYFIRSDYAITPRDRFFFDLPTGHFVQNHGWIFNNETTLMYATKFGLLVGARVGVYHSFFDADAIRGEEKRVAEITPIVYTGPMFMWQFPEFNGPKRFNSPTIFLNTAWWLRHPYRAGQEIPMAVPYLLLGFSFKGTL